MDSMLSAIRARRGKDGPSMMSEQSAPEEQKGGLKDLVASLDENQKQELLALLSQDQKTPDEQIEKGAPSSDEKVAIDEEMVTENSPMAESGSGLSQDQSDEIQKSLVDRSAANLAERGGKPRNLSERAKMYAAKKLKGKGKL